MAERHSIFVPRGLPGLKRKLSNLIKESAFRGFSKKKGDDASMWSKKGKHGKKRHTTGNLTLHDIHEGLRLPNDLRDFSFDYSDGDSFRYSFVGSEFDREPLYAKNNQFSFVSSTFEKELEAGIKVTPISPDSHSDDENIMALPQRQAERSTSKLSSFYGIDRGLPETAHISLETPSPRPQSSEKKREPLAAVNRQVSARPQGPSISIKPQPSKIDYTMTDVPSRISSNRHSIAVSSPRQSSTISQERVPQEAAAISVKRYGVPPALNMKTPTSPAKREPNTYDDDDDDTPITVQKPRHEVKTVNLLKAVGSSENPAARKVSDELAKINRNANASKRLSMPNTPTYAMVPTKRSSVADIRQNLLAKAGQPSSTLPSSSVPSRQSSLRNSRGVNPDTNKRFSHPISLNHVMASQPPTPLATTSSTSIAPRRDSSSSTTASRLAWIKSLEENGGKNPGRDMVFQKLQGGVAAKLAKFEQSNVPLTGGTNRMARSNSTVSKASEAYSIEGGSSFVGKRSSMAESTASTSATNNTVLTNFDENFRAKMESLVAGSLEKTTKDKEKESGKGWTEASKKLQKATIPNDVIDMINLSGADTEVAVNDFVGYAPGGLGRTRTLEEDLKRVSIHDSETPTPGPSATASTSPQKRSFAPPSVPTLDTLLNTPPSTPPSTSITRPTAQSPSQSPASATSSPTRRTKAANLFILVGNSSANTSPVSPTRLMADINSPPCAATFATLSSEALPLAKDEMTPGVTDEMKAETPRTVGFVAAALPSFGSVAV